MCSASSRRTRSRMSPETSTIKRSAPRPERSTATAWALSAAWVTVAPLSIAILVAVVSWPLSVPTIRSRMVKFLFRLLWANGEWRIANGGHSIDCSLFAIRHSLFAFHRPSRPLRLDDFRHRHAELFFHQHDFAAGHQTVVDIDVDRLADLAVELQHRAGAELE